MRTAGRLLVVLLLASAGRSEATPLSSMTTAAERGEYYADFLRDLQNLGGEELTDELLVRAGPCLDQCPVGLRTFSDDRVDAVGLGPKREFHYDREAIPIRTRDEKIHDAVVAIKKYGVQERTFEIVNSRVAALSKLALYCGQGKNQKIKLRFEPLFRETWVMAPDEPLSDDKAAQRDLHDRWLAFTDACDLKKLDLYPTEMQLVRLEDDLGLKRKRLTSPVPFAVNDERAVEILGKFRKTGERLRDHPHLLGRIIGTSIVNLLPDDKVDHDLLTVKLIYYIYDAALYLEKLTAYDADVAAYDELGLTYEHIQDLLFVYLRYHQRYKLRDFQEVAARLAVARIAPPDKVQVRAYPAQSGMDGFAMAYVAAAAVVGSSTVGDSYFPANMMPLGEPVLGMWPGMYFETRFKNGDGVPIFTTGLATEFAYKKTLAAELSAKVAESADKTKTVLIIDDTLVQFDDITNLGRSFSNSTTVLMSNLAGRISAGKLDVILVRSLQKFGSLGTRKTKAGFITVYSANLDPYDRALRESSEELMDTRGRDFQWITFNMEFQDGNEREYIRQVETNAAALAKQLRLAPAHQLGMRTFDLTDELELRAQAFRAMPQFGTFGGPYASHSDLGDVERFSPGLEPPKVLLAKLRFWATNVPLRLRIRHTGVLDDAPMELRDFRYPDAGVMTNDQFYGEVARALSAAGSPPPDKFQLYQDGRAIPPNGEVFAFDFARPGNPVDIYLDPR